MSSEQVGKGAEYGPSYWDVEQRVAAMVKTWDCSIIFHVTVAQSGPGCKPSWWVLAAAHEHKRLHTQPRAACGYGFRGNSGAKTMAAAYFMALSGLEDKLLDIREQAGRQAAF